VQRVPHTSHQCRRAGAIAAAFVVGAILLVLPSSGVVGATAIARHDAPQVAVGGNCNQDHGFVLTYFTDATVSVPSCGPIPLDTSCNTTESCPVYPYPGANTPYPGYQCAELTGRYMWYAFHAGEQLANGDNQAMVYAKAYPSKFTLYTNGTVGHAPEEGDVISMSANAQFSDSDGGHVAIVQSVSSALSTTGTGTLNLVDENDQSSGKATLQMKHWVVQEGINYYTHFEWLQPKSLGGEDQSGRIGEGSNANGWLQLFLVGANGSVYTRYQTSTSGWSGAWSSLGGAFPRSDAIAVATNAKGELEILAAGSDGAMYVDAQTSASAYLSWTGWVAGSPAGIFPPGDPATTVLDNAAGQPQAFAVEQDAQVATSSQSATGAWSAWSSLGGNFGKDGELGAGINASGRLQLFALGPTGELLSDLQNSTASPTSWFGWDPLKAGAFPGAQGMSVGANEDGKLEIYAVTTANTLDTSYLTSGWSAFRSLGGSLNRADLVSVGLNLSGKQQVFAVGRDLELQSTYEVGANTPTQWHVWSTLQPADKWPATDDVLCASDSAGHLHVFLVGANGSLYTAEQSGGGWSTFSSLGGAWPAE
jgi:CHAP domain